MVDENNLRDTFLMICVNVILTIIGIIGWCFIWVRKYGG